MIDVEQLVRIPAHAGPDEPLAPLRAVAPVFSVGSGEGRRESVFGRPVEAFDDSALDGGVAERGDRHPVAGPEEPLHVELFCDGVRSIPPVWLIGGRVEQCAGGGARGKNRLRCMVGVLPARFVTVGPDEHGLACKRRPVGFIHRRVGAMHGGGGADACIDQGLRALLAFDEHHLAGVQHARLVVERARGGRRHLAALCIPRSELLAPAGRIVAVDHRDQSASSVEVFPPGCCWSQFIDGHLNFRAPGRPGYCLSASRKIGAEGEQAREVRAGADALARRDEGEDVAAFAACAVGPQAGLFAREHDLKAVAGATQNVADIKLAPLYLPGREDRQQHGIQPSHE